MPLASSNVKDITFFENYPTFIIKQKRLMYMMSTYIHFKCYWCWKTDVSNWAIHQNLLQLQFLNHQYFLMEPRLFMLKINLSLNSNKTVKLNFLESTNWVENAGLFWILDYWCTLVDPSLRGNFYTDLA
jgi:hypothetical protein